MSKAHQHVLHDASSASQSKTVSPLSLLLHTAKHPECVKDKNPDISIVVNYHPVRNSIMGVDHYELCVVVTPVSVKDNCEPIRPSTARSHKEY